MKKIEKAALRKIRGGDDELTCIRGCREAFQLCVQLTGGDPYCGTYRQLCVRRCLGCNPICP